MYSSSYQLELEGNVLRVGFNRTEPAEGDRIVKDVVEQVKLKIGSGELSGGKLLLIDGPQSVPVAHVLGHTLAHLYATIAVFDPKIGRKGYKSYIVTSSHGSCHRIGDIIETEETQKERTKIKVVLCGPPQSGKSCLRDGLKRATLANINAPYPYVITACPDGEGSWHQKSCENNEDLAKNIKRNNKADLTLEFAQQAAKWVQNANQLLNIIDVGGKISAENELIMAQATHAVILSNDPAKFAEWENFCQQLNLKVIAKIHSILAATNDEVNLVDNWQVNPHKLIETIPILTGSVHCLKRGEDLLERPMIQALAQVLIYLVNN